MKLISFVKFVTVSVVAAACARGATAPPRTVDNLDAERFVGMWYEIARLPFAPQRDCAASATRYERVNDESFGIVSYCWHKSANGPMRKTRAEAYLDTDDAAAKLKIQLNWPAWHDLWILYLSEDYSHALLGTPDRENLWIVSRTPQVDEKDRTFLLDWATREGFDTSRLIFDQVPPVEPAEASGLGK